MRKRGNAADGGLSPSTPAQQSMPRRNALFLSAEEGTSGTHEARRRSSAADGGGLGAGALVGESLANREKQSGLERARRDERHQVTVEKAQVQAPVALGILSNGTRLLASVAARGPATRTAAGNLPLSGGRGQSVQAVPILPAAGSEVVWARRA